MTRRILYAVAAFPLMLTVGGCTLTKSESPLSPTVAGPIPGVTITAPNPVSPRDGVRIANDTQPVTLVLLNASTTSVRPLSYAVDIATDGAFAGIVFTRAGIAQTDGQTSFRLPDALTPNRTYYWRVKAQDGANEGPFSATATFDIVTGAAFGQPVPVSPIVGNYSTNPPTFVWQNAPRTGTPAGTVVYEIQASQTPDFAIALGATQNEQPGGSTTITSPAAGPSNQTFYWRVRATDTASAGPWSRTEYFVTPPGSTGGGGGGNPGGGGGGGGSANQNCHIGGGAATVDRASQAVYGCGEEFPQLLAVFGSEEEAVAAAEQLLLRTIWHLKIAGFDVARQRNPSGAISKDKLNIRIDGAYHVYDIYSLGYAGVATRITGMNDVCPDLLCSSPIPEDGIPD